MQLGTNGIIDPGEFDRMMSLLSDRTRVVIINAKVPRPWEQQVNDTLAAGVKRYKNATLLDWHGYASRTPSSSTTTRSTSAPKGAIAYAEVRGRIGGRRDALTPRSGWSCAKLGGPMRTLSRSLITVLTAIVIGGVAVGCASPR